MREVAGQATLAVICTGGGAHKPRRLGDALVYRYVDGSTYAAFSDHQTFQSLGRAPRTYIGPARSRAVPLPACPSCHATATGVSQERFNRAAALVYDTPGRGPVDVSFVG